MMFLLVLRRVAALMIFVYLVVTFRRAARAAGATPWRWSSLGVLTFYGSCFAVAFAVIGGFVGISTLTGVGFGPAERAMMPTVTRLAIIAGALSGFTASNLVLKRLRARASTKVAVVDTSGTESSVDAGKQSGAT